MTSSPCFGRPLSLCRPLIAGVVAVGTSSPRVSCVTTVEEADGGHWTIGVRPVPQIALTGIGRNESVWELHCGYKCEIQDPCRNRQHHRRVSKAVTVPNRKTEWLLLLLLCVAASGGGVVWCWEVNRREPCGASRNGMSGGGLRSCKRAQTNMSTGLTWPLAVAVILLLVKVAAGEPPPPPPLPLTSRTVRTKYGDVSGVIVSLDSRHLEPVEVFRGVPYASPPVGSLRFMPPVTGALWSGVKMADKFGPVCPQRLPDIANETAALRRMPRGRLEHLRRLLPYLSEQSEDCLYLNIYAPVQGKNLSK